MASWRSLLTGARELTERAWLTQRVVRQTGLATQLRPGGVAALLRSLPHTLGHTDPSLLFRYHGRNTPRRCALICGQRRYSFAQLDREIDALANGLRRDGIHHGDRVVMALRNVPELIVAQAAVTRLGAAAVLVSWRSSAQELAFLLNDSGARALLFHGDATAVVKEAIAQGPLPARRCYAVGEAAVGFGDYQALLQSPPSRPLFAAAHDDAAVVIYTSGTTGKPKGAVRRFKPDMAVALMGFIGQTPMRYGQTHLAVCPLYHSTAFGFVSLSYLLGCTVVLLDRFEPESVLSALARHRVHHTALVPTMLHRLLALGEDRLKAYDLSALEAIFTGGAPLPGPLALRILDSLGDKLFQFYGATETGLVTLATPADMRAAPASIGRALPGNEIRLWREDGSEAPVGEVGELYVCSGNLVDGYHNNQAASAAAMRADFFSVGDLARRDEHGRYFITGRKRDMIISGGVNVYPCEVEEVLAAHPEVAEVAVVGVADEEWGERVHAFVVQRERHQAPSPSSLPALLDEHARALLAGPKRPRGYTLLASLPRNPTGKVLKRQLRATL